MAVCEAKNCKKRESCMNYIENYFEYNPSSGRQSLVDWSNHGSGSYYTDKDGNTIKTIVHDCGDKSYTYPLFESIEKVGK